MNDAFKLNTNLERFKRVSCHRVTCYCHRTRVLEEVADWQATSFFQEANPMQVYFLLEVFTTN